MRQLDPKELPARGVVAGVNITTWTMPMVLVTPANAAEGSPDESEWLPVYASLHHSLLLLSPAPLVTPALPCTTYALPPRHVPVHVRPIPCRKAATTCVCAFGCVWRRVDSGIANDFKVGCTSLY